MNRIKISVANVALCTLAASVFAAACPTYAATQYNYVATTQAKVAAEQGPVDAGPLTWKCAGNECRISGPWATPGLGACKALAQRVGRLASYGYSGHWLSGKELEACNAGIEVSLPSPGVAKNPTSPAKETQLKTGTIQAPSGQLKGEQPSTSPAQEPLANLNAAAVGPIDLPTAVGPIDLPMPAMLSQAELDSMASALNTSGSQSYEYVLWRRALAQGKTIKLDVVSAESIRGILLNRDKAALESLGARYFDDHLGNLVFLGHLVDESGSRFPYSFTATSWGEGVFGADRDSDGVVDVVLGSYAGAGGGRLWMMANDHFKRLWQCIEESALSTGGNDMFDAASLCVPCLDPSRDAGAALSAEETGCANRRRELRSGAGILGGALNSEAMQGLLGEPNCGSGRPGAGITAWDRKPPKYYSRESSDEILDAMLDADLIGERDAAMQSAIDARARAVLAHREGDTQAELAEREFAGAESDYAGALNDVIGTHGEERRIRMGTARVAYRVAVEALLRVAFPSEQPSIGPDGMPETDFADPRCSGNKTAMEQGTMWGGFCRNEDGSHIGMMECARKMSDSVYAISGGRCWQESGPAGGERIVCRQEETARGDGSGGGTGPGGVGGSSSGPTEGPDLGRSSGAGGRYIDTTAMGGFLLALCNKGFCPDVAPMDLDRKRE